MSNAPKTGFFQTIPGLITATAGFLSAATGAIVALNQTGVIDLKKSADNKPPTQVAPLVNPSAVNPVAEAPRGAEVASGGAGTAKPVEPAKQPESAPTSSKSSEGSQSPPVVVSKPADPVPTGAAEVKPADTAVAKTPAPSDEEKLRAIREGAAASAPKQEENLAPTTVPPPLPKQARSPAAITGPASPVREFEEPPSKSTDSRTVETVPHVVKPPPSPSVTDKSRVGRPEPGDRVADARRVDQVPEEDGRGPKIVRPPSEVDGRESGKRVGTDAEPGGRKVIETGRARSPGERSARELDLAGLKLAIPSGWVKEEVTPGPLAPVAALRIPDPAGDGTVQITRYLGAKGAELEERSIERWVGQVTKANGAPASRADAKVERIQLGPVRITTVDLAGTVKMSARDTGEPGQRMFSAIIDHPAGPHLVTIVGPARAMAKWDAAIDGFLRSAKPE